MKVLQIAVGINGGGVGSVIYNYYKNMNHDKVQLDIIIDDLESVKSGSLLEDEFKKMGCHIFRVTPKSKSIKQNAQQVLEIMKSGNYDIVHSHMEEWSALYCYLAKKAGVNTRIAHAHLAHIKSKFIKKMYNSILRTALKHYATHFFACSKDAGLYLFGDKIVHSSSFTVMPNAIDTHKFVFNENIRQKLRDEFKISNKDFVIGFVGRFYYQKNPERMMRIFNEICKINPDSKLLAVGDYKNYDGYKEISSYLKCNSIFDKVIFTGLRTDVNDILQAIDAFVLPSRYEGLGIVYVEAQAAGLMTFGTADVVPSEVKCCSLMHFIDSKESDKEWAAKIIKHSNNYTRKDTTKYVIDSGYEIKTESKKLEQFYLNHIN